MQIVHLPLHVIHDSVVVGLVIEHVSGTEHLVGFVQVAPIAWEGFESPQMSELVIVGPLLRIQFKDMAGGNSTGTTGSNVQLDIFLHFFMGWQGERTIQH